MIDPEPDISSLNDIKPKPKEVDPISNLDKNSNARNRALRLVYEDPLNLASLSLLFQNDREVVQIAVEKLGYSLRHASPALRSDQEIVLSACKQWPHALKFASEELKDNHSFMLLVVGLKGGGIALQYASDRMINEKSIVYAAVQTYGNAMKFASEELRDDPDFLMMCAKSNSMSIRGASDLIQEQESNKEIWMTLIETAGETLKRSNNKNNKNNGSDPLCLKIDDPFAQEKSDSDDENDKNEDEEDDEDDEDEDDEDHDEDQ
mmetsp:Transcript_49612/g.63595  ORF Transcript_49612/g.63595 Transcript_49612/m.63595 type:complete len:263 (+) Transcript_49612:72-860(+)